MSTVTILSDLELKQFLASLDLSAGTEASRTVNAMLTLPASTFAQAMSAVAGGVITFRDLRTLPAMNARLVDSLLSARTGTNDAQNRVYHYRNTVVPRSIDLPGLRQRAIGPAIAYLSPWNGLRWSLAIRPRYDVLRSDPTAFFTYAEAYVAYMAAMSDEITTDLIAGFRARHATFLAAYPVFAQSADPVLAAVEQMAAEPVFLEGSKSYVTVQPMTAFLIAGEFRFVSPGVFHSFMETAYTTMAGLSDPEETGAAGAQVLARSTVWAPLDVTQPGWGIAAPRLARIELPTAYGGLVSSTVELDRQVLAALIADLEDARSTILAIREHAVSTVAGTAETFRASSGSPLGLLLSLTVS